MKSTPASAMKKTAPHARGRAGHIVTAALAAVGISAVTIAVVAGIPSRSASSTLAFPEPMGQGEVAALLARSGLVPDALAAAGVPTERVTTVVDAAESFLVDNLQLMRIADEDVRVAKRERDRLQSLMRSGRGSDQDRAALTAAHAALADAQAVLDALLADAFAAATDGLTAEQVATVVAVREGRASYPEVPVRYLARERSAEEWAALRDALANERISAKRGEEPCPEGTQICLDAQAASAAAQVNLEAGLAAVQAAWDAALAD